MSRGARPTSRYVASHLRFVVPVQARGSIATVSSRGKRQPIGRYRVLHQCKYRAGVAMDSEELG